MLHIFFKSTIMKSILLNELICIAEIKMSKIFSNNKFRITLILIVIIVVATVSILRSRNTKLLDKEAYSAFRTAFDEVSGPDAGGFTDQKELAEFIKKWADDNSLEYKEDKYGNIICISQS